MKYYILEEGETAEESIKAHCGNFFKDVLAAANCAPDNVSLGAKWSIIDQKGNVYETGINNVEQS